MIPAPLPPAQAVHRQVDVATRAGAGEGLRTHSSAHAGEAVAQGVEGGGEAALVEHEADEGALAHAPLQHQRTALRATIDRPYFRV